MSLLLLFAGAEEAEVVPITANNRQTFYVTFRNKRAYAEYRDKRWLVEFRDKREKADES